MRRNVNIPAGRRPPVESVSASSHRPQPSILHGVSIARRPRRRAGASGRPRIGRRPADRNSRTPEDRTRRRRHAETPRLRRRELSAQRFVEQVVAGDGSPERRLAGVRLVTTIDDSRFPGPADPTLITHALAGAIDVLIALFDDRA